MQEPDFIRCHLVVHARTVRKLRPCDHATEDSTLISQRFSGIPARITCPECRRKLGWSKRH